MDNNEIIEQIKKIKRNLEKAKNKIKNVEDVLQESITINDVYFKSAELTKIKNKISSQINIINNRL